MEEVSYSIGWLDVFVGLIIVAVIFISSSDNDWWNGTGW